ncbi:MAG: hypothetical protein NZZ60_07905 [Bacteroidia bacterium]|nr:hypothetical protein [Bacteroidia bacterium]MCX7653013.1 hypothetical protein [Bacteroidia bacterium]MDW8416151.1 GldM family protein [Bacteroidia bacterium]
MASGKLTPRQKMINLMYLVLTALLALNVSAEVLQAFQNLADSLQNTAEQFQKNNFDLAEAIKIAVRKEMEQGSRKNEPLIAEVDKVRSKADSVAGVIRTYIEALYDEKVAGKDPETGRLKRLDERENNYRFWMGKNDAANGGRGEGKALEMHALLDSFVSWANRFYASHSNGKLPNAGKGFSRLVVDPRDNPYVKEKESKEKTWEYFTFHMTPAVANLAVLYKYINDVYVIETELLNLLKSKLGQVTFKIDSLILVDAPRSEIVVAGMKFETKAFVAATSSDAKPTFAGTGAMKLEPGGYSAIFSIPASAASIPAGQRKGKQNYTITARVPKADGSFQELRLQKSFEVVKPEIVVTSAAVQLLYAECGNDLNIDVPALGELYDPRVTADNAQVLQSKQSKKKFRVVPRGGAKTCRLNVATNTAGQVVELGTLDYKVVPPPRPSLRVLINNDPYNGVSPVPRTATVRVQVVPDGDFAKSLPEDARYVIEKPEIKVVKGLAGASVIGSLANSKIATSPSVAVDLTDYSRGLQPGNVLYIQFSDVYRVNFQNKQVKENFSITELTFPITIGK